MATRNVFGEVLYPKKEARKFLKKIYGYDFIK